MQAKKKPLRRVAFSIWLREPDLNRRPSGYEPDELPDCSIPRLWGGILQAMNGLSTSRADKSISFQLFSVGSNRSGLPELSSSQ